MPGETETTRELSIHIVGDAFADLLCYLESGLPVPGGDSRLTVPIETMAGGSAVNTTTHLMSLLRSKHYAGRPVPVPSVTLHTSINPNDEYGKMLIEHASNHGYPLVNCKREDSNLATGHCVVIVSNNDRSFMSHQGCMKEFDAADVNITCLAESCRRNISANHSYIHVAGYYNLPGFWNGRLKELLEQVRTERENLPCEATTTISLVPQHDASEQWDGGILELLPLLDFIIMNELEADGISHRNKDDTATDPIEHWTRFFASASPSIYVIITRGSLGAITLQNGKLVASQAAASVQQVVDPTGAGDAFVAGFLKGLHCDSSDRLGSKEYSIETVESALHWGCAVASCSVLTKGASVPSQPEDINRFLVETSRSNDKADSISD